MIKVKICIFFFAFIGTMSLTALLWHLTNQITDINKYIIKQVCTRIFQAKWKIYTM
jgi:hypothetical protein